jgi:hypothetical protein
MSTPAEGVSENRVRSDWQMTPVIIKTGGGPVDPPSPIKCTIGVENEAFISSLVDDKWQSAMSAQTGSITEVIIDDNGCVSRINTDLVGLAVVQITYGQDLLIVQEVALPHSEFTNLSISSSLKFAVTQGDSPDEWSSSDASVSADPPFIVFTKGSRMEKIHCESTAVTITLKMDWGEAK